MSLQVAILKVLASHVDGRATLASLKRDLEILSTSGPEWHTRLKRLAGRVPSIDIFSHGYVVREDQGWAITAQGQEFLRALEAVTQDNQPLAIEASPSAGLPTATSSEDALIVIGQRFRSRMTRDAASARAR